MKFEKEYRQDFPQTIGETDKQFDMSNYCEWLESQVQEKFTTINKQSTELCLENVLPQTKEEFIKDHDYDWQQKIIVNDTWEAATKAVKTI